ncbi:MAG: choice-of-anchor D domain-containing protein [Desulfuromonadaceae bacterium]
MKKINIMVFLTLALVTFIAWAPEASAFQSLFANCVGCHDTQNAANSCSMCHAHGVHSSSAKSDINLVGQTVDAAGVSKTSYAPGETVFVKITGGYRAGSARIILYGQTTATELARSSGADGMNNAPLFNNTTGITLSSAAPTTPGNYTWNAAWYGNQYDLAEEGGTTFFGPRWTPDPNNPAHGQEIVTTNQFTVTAAAAPIIGVSPTTLAFGTVTIGVPTTLPVTISNTGAAPLNVTGIALGAGTSTEFSWAPPAPFTVAAGASTTLNVTFTPISVGSKTGSIVISSNDPATPTVAVSVSGTGAAAPAPIIALAPPALGFGTVTVGASSTLTTQIQNTGTASLAVSNITVCGGTSTEFSFVQIAPVSILSGQSAQLSVTYAPTNIGADTGCIAITSNDPVNGTINLDLSGTGAAVPTPAITLSPNPLAFGTATIGTPSTLTAQIQSTGTAPLNVTGIALCAGTTEFSFTPITLPASIPVGGNLPLDVTYTPATVGPVTGCINITSDAPVATLNLTGTGSTAPQPVLSVAPTTLIFGNQQVGTSSAPQQVTISNTGTADMTGVSVSSSSTEFVIGGTPTPTVAAGGSTTFTVVFAPTTAGAANATITVTTTNAGSATVSASGTGTSEATPTIALVPNPLAFGMVTIGATSTLTTQIQNSGTANLVVSSITACGLATQFGFTPLTLPLTIPPAGNAVLSVSYTPTTVGAVTDCITIANNDPATPIATLNLTGTGVIAATPVIAVSPNPLMFNTVTIGDAPTLTATIRNTGTADLAVSNIALCAGTTAEFSFVQIAPVTIIPGGSADLNVTYAPTNIGADSGCLDISSNDPVAPITQLNLTGTGVEQQPSEVDIDISKFMASKQVKLKDKGEDKKVNLILWVFTEGAVPGTASATLIGMQNGVQVYKETINVTASPGIPVMFKFPEFVPASLGDIAWTVIIEDSDADVDQATAVTKVTQ